MLDSLRNKIVEIVPGEIKDIKPINPGYDNTNIVLEIVTNEGAFILKLTQEKGDISPFWKGLRELFGAQPGKSESISKVSQWLSEINAIPVPRVLKYGKIKGEKHFSYLLSEKAAGEPIAQDSQNEQFFTSSADIARQLGRHLAKLRALKFESIGNITNTMDIAPKDFPKALSKTILKLASQPPASENDEVQENLAQMLSHIEAMPAPQHIHLIMPDLWPSQFLLKDHQISALIDIESYVRGPIELELAVLELWLEDFDSFRQGYEFEGARLPDLSPTRDIYRFLLYLLHGCPPQGLRDLFSSKIKL